MSQGIVHRDRGPKPVPLPIHTDDIDTPKIRRALPESPWALSPFTLSTGARPRRLRGLLLRIRTISQSWRRRCLLHRVLLSLFFIAVVAACVGLVLLFLSMKRRTLVFGRENLQRIWKWEVASGHHPSRKPVPKEIGLRSNLMNPALAPGMTKPGELQTVHLAMQTLGNGPRRVYQDIAISAVALEFPPRPAHGSIADFDVIMNHCDYDKHQYVRDCLEFLRVGAGLDNKRRLRRSTLHEWRYIYTEEHKQMRNHAGASQSHRGLGKATHMHASASASSINQWSSDDDGLRKKLFADWEPALTLPEALTPRSHTGISPSCDDNHPRIFHMFWTGPFTDKPYMAVLSFLFTQNVGTHLHEHIEESSICRPQLWFWINPGPAGAILDPSEFSKVLEELMKNRWSAPFFHSRFKDLIHFKQWNFAEQLDSVAELKDEWRSSKVLLNSGGHRFLVPQQKSSADIALNTTSANSKGDNIYNRVGSASEDKLDKLSTVMSDIARFILCHRFGGVYLDADVLLLRDWEELWGWKGAFAYRWSRIPDYNTAILRLHKNSALGTFILRTALKNAFDFHPMKVTRYLNDAYLRDLLYRLPDALFDPAWLNIEIPYQRERPPQPMFDTFTDFFQTSKERSAEPGATGFDGFFRGAYCYHWHNHYWLPFDRTRDWPDLGPRFAQNIATENADENHDQRHPDDPATEEDRDLDWSAVMKRTFESYIRGERPNMYGEWIAW